MDAADRTWHHGLVARYWGEKLTDAGKETGFFDAVIASSGVPVLDAGCGSGRLLVPWLRAGIDADGCDVSADMLEQCRRRAQAEGLAPRLYRQAMHEIDLPRRYRTIIMCGAFGLGGDSVGDLEGLRRCYRHLEPGGTLALDCDVAWASGDDWNAWRSTPKCAPWPPFVAPGERDSFEDGTRFEMHARRVGFDAMTQVSRLEFRVQHYVADAEPVEEIWPILIRVYTPAELVSMLQQVGFERIEAFADYTRTPATLSDDVHVFVAHKHRGETP